MFAAGCIKKWIHVAVGLCFFSQGWTQKQVMRIITVSDSRISVDVWITADSLGGFVKFREKIQGGKLVRNFLKLPEGTAVLCKDTGCVWIFPEVRKNVRLKYNLQRADTIVRLTGILTGEFYGNHVLCVDTILRFINPVLLADANNKLMSGVTAGVSDTTQKGNPYSPAGTECRWRVQIAASVTPLPVEKYKDRLSADLDVYQEKIDGWYKYTTGCFNQYEEAARLMQELANRGFHKPFLVKYVNGVRKK